MVSDVLTKTSQPHKKRLLIPFALLLLLTTGTVGLYLYQTAHLLDQQEIVKNTKLAQAALTHELNTLANLTYDYGYRDASVKNLLEQPDLQWAKQNIGHSLYDSHNISASLVFDNEDLLKISFINGKKSPDNSFLAKILTAIQPFLLQSHEISFLEPKSVSGLIKVNQQIYLTAAAAILPEKTSAIPEQHPGVLILLKKIDRIWLEKISRNYLLPELQLTQIEPASPLTGLQLKSQQGAKIGFLQWLPNSPGQKIFLALAPAIPIPLLLALILTLLFVHRTHDFFQERNFLLQQIEQEKNRLEQSEGTLRTIIEAIPSPLFFKNSEGYYLSCNKAFCDYIGLPTEKIVGHTVYDVAPGELASVYHQADLKLMQQSGAQTYEAQVRYADGTHRDILFNKATIDSIDGKVIGLVGIMTDISDVKAAQRESRRLRQLLRNVIDSMPSLLITVDEEQCVTEWNRWATVVSRVPAEQALGRPLFDVFPALAEHHIDLSSALTSGKVHVWRRIPWTFQKREIFIDLTVYPLDKSKGKGAVLRADNTTDRVRMDEMMVLGEKMLSIGSLAAGMAHEINNPLAIILQHTQILQNRLNPQLDKNLAIAKECQIDLYHLSDYLQQRGISNMLTAIRQAGDRAKAIVEEMVNFSQYHESEYAPCDLPALVDETLHLAQTDYDLKKKYAFREICISQNINPKLPTLVCDRHEIQQVLLNLLKNSAKEMYNFQTTDPQITIELSYDSENIYLVLTDNGPGIDSEIMNRIFDPFFTTNKVGQGTGLGLSVAYFIIHDKHGGKMRAENIPTGGCRIRIELPRKSQSSTPKEIA